MVQLPHTCATCVSEGMSRRMRRALGGTCFGSLRRAHDDLGRVENHRECQGSCEGSAGGQAIGREDEVTERADSKTRTPEAELRSWIQRLDPKVQKLMRSVRAAVRKRFPTAHELAYDYSSHVVISYSPTDRAIDAIVAIAGRADGVRLYLMNGPQLPDPKGLLLGSGKQTRFVHVEAASQLTHPDLKALIAAAVDQSTVPLPSKGEGKLIIKSSTAKRSPRRKPAR
jgi:hypothetical protein